MSGGVFCPTCSSPLTWFPQLQQWGCDRCRMLVATPVQMAAPQQMVPQMAPMQRLQAPPQPAKRASRAPLAIGGVLLAGGIITVAVVASGGGSSKTTASSSSSPAVRESPTTTTATATGKPTLGDPVQAPVGDFWIWPRSDGTFLVSSPDLVAVFPRKPTFTFSPARNASDGDVYTVTDDYGEAGKIQLSVMATGKKLKDAGASAPPAKLAEMGEVTTRTFEDHGIAVTEYSVESRGAPMIMRMNVRADHAHGMGVTSLFGATGDASHARFVDAFLGGLHLDASHDIAGDFSELTSKPSGSGFVVSDPQFHIELPWQPKIERGRQHDDTFAKISMDHGDALITLTVIEMPAWGALRESKEVLDRDTTETADALTKALAAQHAKAELARSNASGMPVRVIQMRTAQGIVTENWSAWDRYGHRLYQLTCVHTDCAKVMRTLTLTPPKPAPPAN